MEISFYEASAAMTANAAWYDMLSQNLAAGSAPGFKRLVAGFEQYQFTDRGIDPGTTRASYPVLKVGSDLQQGPIRSTGAKTDLAIDGPGYLVFQLPDRSLALSRDGELHLDAQGNLVGKGGLPLMGAAGPIRLNPNAAKEITIGQNGEVSQGDNALGQIRLVDVASPRDLVPLGAGLFKLPQTGAAASTGSSVVQGFLEDSNTQSMREMTDLILSVRHFEANQRVLQSGNERMTRTIQELGAVPIS